LDELAEAVSSLIPQQKKKMKPEIRMNTRERIKLIFLTSVFICYIIFLMKLLFLSRISLSETFSSPRNVDRSINLIPFTSIKEYLFDGSADVKRFAFSNVVGNMAMFIPLGTYLSVFQKDKRIKTGLLLIGMVSLSIEVIQGLFGIGTADIDDVLLNSAGGLIGILGYTFLAVLLRDETKVRTAITILSAIGLPYLLFLLFMVQLRL
jgi:glycopeptide antibiotics resistance protein